jgi:hypothetical protein
MTKTIVSPKSKSAQNATSVNEFIASLDEQTLKDTNTLIKMMQGISGSKPNVSIVQSEAETRKTAQN